MRVTQRKHLWRYRSCCLLTCLAITAYLTSTIGFPLPTSRAKEPSPSSACQAGQCGCSEADRNRDQCCCSRRGRGSEKEKSPSRSKGQSPSSAWVLGVNVLRCHGLSTSWITTGAVLVPPPAVTWSPSWALTGWLWYRDAESNLRVQSPPDPPPRSAHL